MRVGAWLDWLERRRIWKARELKWVLESDRESAGRPAGLGEKRILCEKRFASDSICASTARLAA